MGSPSRLWGFIRCFRCSGLWCFVPTSLVLRLLASNAVLPVNWVQGAFSHCGCGLRMGGPLWTSKRVSFRSHNSVVEILQSDPKLNGFGLLAARHSLPFTASPVRGQCNPIADTLSHFFLFQHFCQLAPYTALHQIQVPQELLLDLDLIWQANAVST